MQALVRLAAGLKEDGGSEVCGFTSSSDYPELSFSSSGQHTDVILTGCGRRCQALGCQGAFHCPVPAGAHFVLLWRRALSVEDLAALNAGPLEIMRIAGSGSAATAAGAIGCASLCDPPSSAQSSWSPHSRRTGASPQGLLENQGFWSARAWPIYRTASKVQLRGEKGSCTVYASWQRSRGMRQP